MHMRRLHHPLHCMHCLSLSCSQETVSRKQTRRTNAGAEAQATMAMKRRSVLALLVVAFVGGNLLLGASFSARSTVKSSASDPTYGTAELNGRRLKESRHDVTDRKTRNLQDVKTDDYQPIDPSPSSKASIRPAPIEHGTPLLPYVPRYPPPPAQPKDARSAQSAAAPVA
ncbi:hypothetical protein VPH35_074157 [Triticum aestivum]